jgi:hypothetical protein
MTGGWGGATGGIDIQGMLITPTAVTVILASCALRTRYWTVMTAFFLIGSWVLTFVLLIVLDDLFCPDSEEPVQACGISITPVLSEVCISYACVCVCVLVSILGCLCKHAVYICYLFWMYVHVPVCVCVYMYPKVPVQVFVISLYMDSVRCEILSLPGVTCNLRVILHIHVFVEHPSFARIHILVHGNTHIYVHIHMQNTFMNAHQHTIRSHRYRCMHMHMHMRERIMSQGTDACTCTCFLRDGLWSYEYMRMYSCIYVCICAYRWHDHSSHGLHTYMHACMHTHKHKYIRAYT